MNQLTRREWTAMLASASAVAAQEPAREAPRELLDQARQNTKRNSEALSKYKIPMAVEPAFQFKA